METSVSELIKDKTISEASAKINELKKELETQKDLRIVILEDYIRDNKESKRFQTKIIHWLLIAIFMSIIVFACLYVYSNYQLTNLGMCFVTYLDKITPPPTILGS